MTRFAFGAKCGGFGRERIDDAAGCGRRVAAPGATTSAIAPRPTWLSLEEVPAGELLQPFESWDAWLDRRAGSSALHQHFVEVQQHVADDGPGGQVGDVGSLGRRAERIGRHLRRPGPASLANSLARLLVEPRPAARARLASAAAHRQSRKP